MKQLDKAEWPALKHSNTLNKNNNSNPPSWPVTSSVTSTGDITTAHQTFHLLQRDSEEMSSVGDGSSSPPMPPGRKNKSGKRFRRSEKAQELVHALFR
mmetsp:Transcript_19604/g.26588  ORF Transcript_19604/g.26588 Transcript_19604/m.26588 type:complete len:98 (+) Transcript_19604:94-387(+)|eukprot:CAMPEP_0185778236 /NCGR_PEP_ID=MMETSP1174-20130828/91932_1 /TAXON_ID=35687 /ORGANISM="Dictyocha speculum, Strain CCMP1381" /LENGTH=97 /DNA_ID=CAMNT_0028466875 /DNA_START=67 /DNA_END=360 /DNA_ORIENTATION=+